MLPVIARAALEQRQAIFSQVVSYYVRSSSSPGNELDFIAFLQEASKQVPKHAGASAASEMARRLQRYAASNPSSNGELRVSTDKGVANISNPGDRIIWAALPTLRSIDPNLADQLRASRPALNVSALVNAQVRSETPYGYPRGEQQRREQQPVRNRGDAIRWLNDDATADPQHASQLAAAIADPVARASTLANLAAAQSQDTVRSQALLQEAFDQLARIESPQSLVWAASRVAEAAEKLHNQDVIVKCLDEGFAVARAHIAAERDSPLGTRRLLASNGYGAYFLARVGGRVVPALTVQRVATLNDPATEAFLLVAIAEQLPPQ